MDILSFFFLPVPIITTIGYHDSVCRKQYVLQPSANCLLGFISAFVIPKSISLSENVSVWRDIRDHLACPLSLQDYAWNCQWERSCVASYFNQQKKCIGFPIHKTNSGCCLFQLGDTSICLCPPTSSHHLDSKRKERQSGQVSVEERTVC